MSARTSLILGVIMYAPIVAIAISVGNVGYQLLTQDQPHGITPSAGFSNNVWN